MSNNSIRAGWGVENGIAETDLTGTPALIVSLPQNPVHMLFDNQTNTYVSVYVNQTTDIWHTFSPGEALVLDMRANHGIADNFTADFGTSFYASGTPSGTPAESFLITYTFAR